MSLAKALPRPCPTCGEVAGGVFCPNDGTPLEGAFSISGERYVVEELIGNGAMAIVFGGKHRTLSRPVAVKILRPEVAQNAEQQQRFLREARSASRLNHENIVGVLDFGWDDELGVTYMVMERLFGQTLASELGHGGRMGWREVVSLLVQICRALHAAHSLGIVHRDLTSRNVILVQASGRRVVKLCDFGLSRQTAGGDRVTQNGEWVGTPAYMAPEQLDSDPAIEASADIYSLGVLAHEMLTGHLPVEGASVVEMVAAKLTDTPLRMSERFPDLGLPDDLEQVVIRCMERDPAQRPTATELERILVRIDARATQAGPALERSSAPSAPTFPALDDEGVPTMVGSYRVVRLIGTGGTGRVYLGEHPVIGTKVAIKILLPEIAGSRETVERFIQEARSSSQIESPHIPRYHDFGRTAGGLPYAVMEYFEGETLAERIEKVGALSVPECADILGQVAEALQLAHNAGLVHRDLKPENIFLVAAEPRVGRMATDPGSLPAERTFNVKVLDFGIAKTFGKESGTRTQQGFFLGTPFYCAPEQVFGAEVGPRADVYGLGATAFEMLTGLPPFIGEISEVLEAKTSKDAPRLRASRPELPEPVERTVERMLARDPAARAESMTWVQEQVTAWLRPVEDAEPARSTTRSGSQAATTRSGSQAAARGGSPTPRALAARSAPMTVPPTSGSSSRPAASSTVELSEIPSLVAATAATSQPMPLAASLGSSIGSSLGPSLELDSSSFESGFVSAGGSRPGLGFATSPDAPIVVEATRPRRARPADDSDFDALETVTLLPGSHPMVRIAMQAPPQPLWRRPALLGLGAVALLAAVAIAYVELAGSSAAPAQLPLVTPIDPGASPVAGEPPSRPVASHPGQEPAGEDPGAAKIVSPGPDGPAEPEIELDDDEGSEALDDPKVRGSGKTRPRHHGKGKLKGDPSTAPGSASGPGTGPAVVKDPPPVDVKIVDPFGTNSK